MRVIVYDISAVYTDEYLRTGEDITIECLRSFAKVIIRLFGDVYLRAPSEEDRMRKRGWSGMLGSVDCMH